jgi:hypothetical protein
VRVDVLILWSSLSKQRVSDHIELFLTKWQIHWTRVELVPED